MSELTVGTLSGLSANNFVIDVASGSKIVQPGAVLQVVSTVKTDTFSTNSTSLTDITGLSATITPTFSTSKILVLVNLNYGADTTNIFTYTMTDGSNNVLVPAASPGSRTAGFVVDSVTTLIMRQASYGLLHSPATTSATTYKIRGLSSSGTIWVNRSSEDANDPSRGRAASTITLMEIAG